MANLARLLRRGPLSAERLVYAVTFQFSSVQLFSQVYSARDEAEEGQRCLMSWCRQVGELHLLSPLLKV